MIPGLERDLGTCSVLTCLEYSISGELVSPENLITPPSFSDHKDAAHFVTKETEIQ